MSFGDIARGAPRSHASLLTAPVTPAASPTPAMEFRGTLNALAANNAALRRTSAQLRAERPEDRPSLSRVRQLREQNREIAQAASVLKARVDDPEAQRQFQALIGDFSSALHDSMRAERDALESSSARAAEGEDMVSPTSRLTEGQVAVQAEENALEARPAAETDPLLPSSATRLHTASEAAVLREIQGNDSLVRERNQVLTEIQSSVEDVNSIFNDLAVMIGDQRTQVEYVEVTVGDATENMANARRELIRTQRRRERRKSFFFCALISIALVIALFLIILLS